jgi:hypothetical protein
LEHFRELGYEVEAGPGTNETTLIDDQRPDHQSHIVLPNDKLAGMADLSKEIRMLQLFRQPSGTPIGIAEVA